MPFTHWDDHGNIFNCDVKSYLVVLVSLHDSTSHITLLKRFDMFTSVTTFYFMTNEMFLIYLTENVDLH